MFSLMIQFRKKSEDYIRFDVLVAVSCLCILLSPDVGLFEQVEFA